MALIDFLLNVAGLLLWCSWRAARFDPVATATPSTLAGTLRRAGRAHPRRWRFLVALAGLIVLRAVAYRQIGPAIHWTGTLELSAISISFRSDDFWKILLYSALSFGMALVTMLLWLLVVSLIQPATAETETLRRFVRLHLGPVDRLPRSIKAVLPVVAVTCLWWLLSWPLAHWAIVPRPASALQRFEQALIIGTGSYLLWKYFIVGVLVLYLVNSYVFFGNHPIWTFVNAVARQLLRPFQWLPLRVGRVDFAPILAAVLVLLAARLLESGLLWLYLKLPA